MDAPELLDSPLPPKGLLSPPADVAAAAAEEVSDSAMVEVEFELAPEIVDVAIVD